MKRSLLLVLSAMLAFGWCSCAAAELCKRCQGKPYILSVGKCTSCGGVARSGAFKLCPKCSGKQRKCEHCLSLLKGPKPPQPERIDLNKAAAYASGKWKYRLRIAHPGTRSEGKWGTLTYGGKQPPVPEINDYYQTPWGAMYWVGMPEMRSGWHGWMPQPSGGGARKGRLLTLPGDKRLPPALTEKDDGKTLSMAVKKRFVVRLAGNPTTGYGWRTVEVTGDAVEQTGKVAYVAAKRQPGMVGVGGHYVFRFEAVKPGKTSIKLEYARPWEKDKPPAKTFTVTINVRGRRTRR